MIKSALISTAVAILAGMVAFGNSSGLLPTLATGLFFIMIPVTVFLFASHFLQPRRPVY